MSLKKANVDVNRNIRVHNRIAKSYERNHGEIYNDIEQGRLREDLKSAVSQINTGNAIKTALDFGCGAGNLTVHLSALGCEIIACDVSDGFLELVGSHTYDTAVKTVQLNGKDLSNIPDNSVDMVATYSVMHHVPDYLGIVEEFIRVLKVGGVLYIDHERSKDFWLNNKVHKEFEQKMRSTGTTDFKKYFRISNYVSWAIRKFVNPRYRSEGDIHVFPDDHIEWDKIAKLLNENSMEIVLQKDYLLYKRIYDYSVYCENRDSIQDTHLLVARKC